MVAPDRSKIRPHLRRNVRTILLVLLLSESILSDLFLVTRIWSLEFASKLAVPDPVPAGERANCTHPPAHSQEKGKTSPAHKLLTSYKNFREEMKGRKLLLHALLRLRSKPEPHLVGCPRLLTRQAGGVVAVDALLTVHSPAGPTGPLVLRSELPPTHPTTRFVTLRFPLWRPL